MVYIGHSKTYNVPKFKTIRAFGDIIKNNGSRCRLQTMDKVIWQSILKKENWCLKHLKLEYFQDLNNQKNQDNQATMLNIVQLVEIYMN